MSDSPHPYPLHHVPIRAALALQRTLSLTGRASHLPRTQASHSTWSTDGSQGNQSLAFSPHCSVSGCSNVALLLHFSHGSFPHFTRGAQLSSQQGYKQGTNQRTGKHLLIKAAKAAPSPHQSIYLIKRRTSRKIALL